MMRGEITSPNLYRLSGAAGILGVLLLILSFNINPGPPQGASPAELVAFGKAHFHTILWGAWLQAIGPLLIIILAFALVHKAGHMSTLGGWLTFFGATCLMTVSLIEITFYIAVLFRDPQEMGLLGLNTIYAVQHLYFIVGAPALFIPLGWVILRSAVLPAVLGWMGLALGCCFFLMGILFLYDLVLPIWVTAFAGVQALWWLSAAIVLIRRSSGHRSIADRDHPSIRAQA